MIRVGNEQFQLYTAVDPETNKILHVRLYPGRTAVITETFLCELREKHDVEPAKFLVGGALWLQQSVIVTDSDFSLEHMEI